MEMEEAKECVGGRSSSSKKMIEMAFREYLRPHILSVLSCLSHAGFNIISKVSLDKGMNRYVLVVYGHALGTFATAFLALLFERHIERKLTLPVLRNIFFLGLLGAVLGRTLFYAGLEYSSSTFASTMSNLVPSFTFILAILFRMERFDISKGSAQAKMGGTAMAFAGATLTTLYKGIVVISPSTRHCHQPSTTSKILVDRKWIKGSLMLLVSYFSIAASFVLQTTTIKKYPAPISLTSLTCLMGTFQAAIMTAIVDHKTSSWRLSWNISLLAPIYSGIIVFGITAYVQILIIQIKGPVFMTAYRPLSTLFVAIMGLLILGDALHLGSIIGATLIIIGLYAIMWGKEKEKEKKLMEGVIHDQSIEIKMNK
ncbi:hypothetical protein L1049_023355 [Liquidambar formosana]|uniref:WAT1-related protein n=1 Tax=Liquidambar formosana TaxID=63359 RepID=A0AAP0RTC4_LIQFO